LFCSLCITKTISNIAVPRNLERILERCQFWTLNHNRNFVSKLLSLKAELKN
jgi:hypothetical protein